MNAHEAHAAAIFARLRADVTPSPLRVLDGEVPKDQPMPYVLVYLRLWTPSGVEVPEKVSLENTSDVIETYAYCHSVGSTPASSRVTAGRVRVQLLGFEPTIAGRICYPITHDDGGPTGRDEATGAGVFDLIDVYKFTSQPG